jgi:hypothetical protein
MTEETPQDDETLRDRIVKIETIVDFHDREFQNVKGSISDLSKTMDEQHHTILEKMEEHNKNFMDVTYSRYREQEKQNEELRDKIQDNRNVFDNWVSKWKAISWAVWFTISVTLGAVGWGLTTAKDLGLFNISKETIVEIKQNPES